MSPLDAEISLYLVAEGKTGSSEAREGSDAFLALKIEMVVWEGGKQPPGTDPQSRGARISNNQNEFGGRFFLPGPFHEHLDEDPELSRPALLTCRV